jgi:hypothetical protein
MENVYIIVCVLWGLGMLWFIHEIVWGVRRVRYLRMLRSLSDDELTALYRKQWLQLNTNVIKNRLKRMHYVEILKEMIRRNLYLGKIVN